MKTVTKISMLLNVILGGVLIYVWECPQQQLAATGPTRLESPTQAASNQTAPMVVRQVIETTKPFRWNQLVSSNDYRVFVANLRSAGCPEATVEDIVRGDAERAFYFKRSELHVDGTRPGPWSAQSQMQMVAYLLGQASSPSVAVADNTASPPANRPSVEVAGNAASSPANRPPSVDSVVSTPLILRNFDLQALGLNNEQVQAFNNVRQQFLDQVGGGNQDSKISANPTDSSNPADSSANPADSSANPTGAADPAYVAQVQQAANTADSQLPAVLGNAYGTYLWMATAQQAYEYSVQKLQQRSSRN